MKITPIKPKILQANIGNGDGEAHLMQMPTLKDVVITCNLLIQQNQRLEQALRLLSTDARLIYSINNILNKE